MRRIWIESDISVGKEEVTDLYFWKKKSEDHASKLIILRFGIFVYEYLRILKTLIAPRTWA